MHPNKSVIRALYDAFARGDIQAVLSALEADTSWTQAEGFPYAGTFIGPDAILANVFMKLGTEWDGWAAIPHELIAEEETVVALGEYSGAHKATGKSFRAPFVHVWKFENGQVKSFVQHTDTVLVRDAMQ